MEVYNNNDGSTGKLSTSKGNQIKFLIGNEWHKADFLGYEGASEYVCSQLAKYTNIEDFVEYRIEEISINNKRYNGCVSKNYLNSNEITITADRLIKKYKNISAQDLIKSEVPLSEIIQIFVNTITEITKIEDFGKKLTQLLEWDKFVLNEDRHFNNIAFIYNEVTDSFRMTPVFDNGAAFLSDIRNDYPLDSFYLTGLINSVSSKPFHKDFDTQVEACEKLYGTVLKISKDISISLSTKEELSRSYGDKIADRIVKIFEHQKFINKEMLSEENKKIT